MNELKTLPNKKYISDSNWNIIKDFIPEQKNGGRPRKTNMRLVLEAIFYVLESGCSWRHLPPQYPNYNTVYYYFNQFKKLDIFEKLNDYFRNIIRETQLRDIYPSIAMIDSQSSKTSEFASESGYDPGKKVKGTKRHLMVDSLGLVLNVKVTPANIPDREGAKLILTKKIVSKYKKIQTIYADSAYAGKLINFIMLKLGVIITIVKRKRNSNSIKKDNNQYKLFCFDEDNNLNIPEKRFVVQPHRWIVERTFAWLIKNRRLSKDYERYPSTTEAFIYLAMVKIMMRRKDKLEKKTF